MAETEAGTIIIRGGLLADTSLRRAAPADVLVRDGVIVEIGAGIAAPPDAKVVDAAGTLMHPGLINAHTHGHGGLARGQGDKWTLELLLAAAPWIGGSRSLQDKKLTTQIVAAEMVLKGCTAAYDLYYEFPMPTAEGLDAVAEAYAGVGMRAVVAPMVADKTVYEAIPGLYDSAARRAAGTRRQAAPAGLGTHAGCDARRAVELALERQGHPRGGRADHPASLLRCLHVRLPRPGARLQGRAAQPCRREQGAGAGRHAHLWQDAGAAHGQPRPDRAGFHRSACDLAG